MALEAVFLFQNGAISASSIATRAGTAMKTVLIPTMAPTLGVQDKRRIKKQSGLRCNAMAGKAQSPPKRDLCPFFVEIGY